MTIDIDTMPAGPALDRLVATEVMGRDLKPSRDYAKEEVGWRFISCTGNPFELRDGRQAYVPKGDDLPHPADDCKDTWNARYVIYVVDHYLNENGEIEEELDAVHLPVELYSIKPGPAMEVVEKMGEMDYWFSSSIMSLVNGTPVSITAEACFQKCPIMDRNPKHHAHAETFELAVCRAAYKAKMGEKQ